MLKRWQAVRFGGVLENGRTKPMILECLEIGDSIVIDPDAAKPPARREFVVKALGNPEVDQSYITKELLGNLLSRRYGLNTPEPAIVVISDAFVRAVNPRLQGYGYQIRPGAAAGCEYFRGGFSFPPAEALLSEDELAQMAQLYGFDLAVQNPDRLPIRPNCALKGGRLIAFDFDSCFSFLYVIGAVGEAWEVSKHGIAPTHLCHRRLQAKKDVVTWQGNKVAVSALSNEVLGNLTSWIADKWSVNASTVCTHVAAIRDHVDAFEMELQGSVA